MRKILGLVLIVFLVLSIPIYGLGVVNSQDPDYQKAFNDFVSARENYNREYANYQKARDFYLQNKTLGLKESARVQTVKTLVARDELLSTYVTAVRLRLDSTPYHPGAERGDILSDLVGDAPWYRNHKSVYNLESDTIETIFQKGAETTQHFDTISSKMVYRALSTIAFSRYLDIKSGHENIYWPLLAEAEKTTGSERELLNRWISDIDKEFQKVTDVENAVKKIREEYLTTQTKPESLHAKLVSKLSEGKDSLLAVNGFITEMNNVINK